MTQDTVELNPFGSQPKQLPVQPLTDDQVRFVMDLFQKYPPGDLCVEDAVEIIEALENAGLRGPAVRTSLMIAGLDPQKFRALISINAVLRP
ncbi:hypothetical protein LARV_00071 [Longilinea arvoryzae]|uniref:Uncharacterized protein n=1 Tax=Longilinea arvoryzae TaxID=360412 RepID=A0A0S7BED2_9CHLR|nr:hypothetical protein [Longilinea arvoryzae]GAP12338.1 hypothetical protein LARV_00071 [Longilinea arvoryzae]